MKRFLCLLLILALLFSGCTLESNRLKEPVTFYYPLAHDQQENYDEFFSTGVIGRESWEASGHRNDLNYLLSMYLQGPLDKELKRPFPYGCKILEIARQEQSLTVTLNAIAFTLDDMQLTVACACLATTCMELADAETVTVQSIDPDKKILFTRSFTSDSLLLEDTTTVISEAAEETQ